MLRSSSGLGDGHSCFCNGFAAACLLLATACLGFSQITNVTNDQSTPIPGAGHDYLHILTETVNPANGSVSLRIQVPMPKGRWLTLPFAFAYDSSGAQHLGDVDAQAGAWWDERIPFAGRRTLADDAGWYPPSGNATVFSHINQVESATAFTNYSGGLENERLYYPWGHYWTQLGPTMEEVYGGITDDQELYAALQRRQNPGLGRWMTPDPAGLAAIDLMNPQSWNAYAYALNNPTTLTDPEGTDVQVCINNENGGQSCNWYSDEEYNQAAAAQNAGKNGITAPVGDAQNGGHPNGDIMCGGSVCGTVKWGDAPAVPATIGPVEIGLAFAGGVSLVRGAAEGVVEGIANGVRSFFESETPEAEPLGLRTAGAMEGRVLPALNRLEPKIQRQMVQRGWTRQGITDAFERGERFPAVDRTAGGAPATRYVNPGTGKYVVINNATGKVIQVGGAGFIPH